jgi:integrase
MRKGGIRGLQWKHIDKNHRFIRLPGELLNEGKYRNRPKVIPVNHHVADMLARNPQPIHHDHVFTYCEDYFFHPTKRLGKRAIYGRALIRRARRRG